MRQTTKTKKTKKTTTKTAILISIVAACAASDDGGECGAWWAGQPSSDAWMGAVAACQRAPACPHTTSCEDPRWGVLADWALDQIAACFAGPCEERAACVAAALPPSPCWRDPPDRRSE